ncbi:hypothetical protein OXB_0208 [Bacillus sp. OxB-1]|nr:hypothetical protein OXB_0208 [Bacillus sp. OxB-1]
MKRNFLFYWRIFVLVSMILLFVTKVISPDTFIAMLVSIIVFVIIPETIKAKRDSDGEDTQ